MIDICPACGAPTLHHWRCAVCGCFGHKNVIARYDRAICTTCEAAIARRGAIRCRTCGKIKLRAEFPPHGQRKCLLCRKARRRAYYEQHRAEEIAYAVAYEQRNREWKRAIRRRYHARHRDRIHLARKRSLFRRVFRQEAQHG